MSIEDRLPTFSYVFNRQIVFWGRSDVRVQTFAIVLTVIVGWLLSKHLWQWLTQTFPRSTTFVFNDQRLSLRQYGAMLAEQLGFPLISLVLLNLILVLFARLDWTRGMLELVIWLQEIYVVYRFFIASLYAAFPLAEVRAFHLRLFAPLALLYLLRTIVSLYSDLNQFNNLVLFKLFNSPVSIGSIFVLIAGLYFWTVVVILLEDRCLRLLTPASQVEVGTLQASLLLIRYFLICLGVVVILGYVGFNGTALAAITGGLSVGIGFGLQQVVSNFVSGILLLFERVLKPGDLISIGGQTCEVKKLGIRATTVLIQQDNSEKIIPNQTFFTSDVTTYTGSDRLVYCSIPIGVGYDSNAQEVMDLLLEIAHDHPKIMKDPNPVAFFLNFGDSSLNFELKFWLNDINIKKRVTSDLSCDILARFRQHHIEIPFPQRDVHLYSQSDESSI